MTDRLRKLAVAGARQAHNAGTELQGHIFPYKFETCPHSDCVLVRGVAAVVSPHQDVSKDADTDCDNDVCRRCSELWPDSRDSWCEGCLAAAVVSPVPQSNLAELLKILRDTMRKTAASALTPTDQMNLCMHIYADEVDRLYRLVARPETD
jgi:hypothetical protein